MAFFSHEGHQVYYEVHGEAEKTLIILNGIMMSAASWQPFIKLLKEHVRVVLVDFIDQGKSSKTHVPYDQSLQVGIVKALIDHVRCSSDEMVLLGISYGGEIAMKVAVEAPEAVDALILANTTDYTDPQLKAVGDAWINAAKTYDGRVFFKATIPPIYSGGFYERQLEWLSSREKMFSELFKPEWYEAFIRLVISAENHDERHRLSRIKVPTLVIGADQDQITPLRCQKRIAAAISNARFMVIPECGHASMYEKPHEFFAMVLGFIGTAKETFEI